MEIWITILLPNCVPFRSARMNKTREQLTTLLIPGNKRTILTKCRPYREKNNWNSFIERNCAEFTVLYNIDGINGTHAKMCFPSEAQEVNRWSLTGYEFHSQSDMRRVDLIYETLCWICTEYRIYCFIQCSDSESIETSLRSIGVCASAIFCGIPNNRSPMWSP